MLDQIQTQKQMPYRTLIVFLIILCLVGLVFLLIKVTSSLDSLAEVEASALKIQSQEQKIIELNRNSSLASSQLAEVETTLAVRHSKLESLNQQIFGQIYEIQQFNASLRDKEKRLASRQNNIEVTENLLPDLDNLTSELLVSGSELNYLKSEIIDKNRELKTLDEKINSSRSQIYDLELSKTEQANLNQRALAEYSKKQVELTSIQGQLNRLNLEHEKLLNFRSKNLELQESISLNEQRVNSLKEEKELLADENEKLKNDLVRVRKGNYAELTNRINEVNQAMNKAEKESKDKIKNLEKMVSRLELTLNEVTSSYPRSLSRLETQSKSNGQEISRLMDSGGIISSSVSKLENRIDENTNDVSILEIATTALKTQTTINLDKNAEIERNVQATQSSLGSLGRSLVRVDDLVGEISKDLISTRNSSRKTSLEINEVKKVNIQTISNLEVHKNKVNQKITQIENQIQEVIENSKDLPSLEQSNQTSTDN